VIAIFCGKLRGGGRPTVFGDGDQTRDYIFVGDVVEAALAAAAAEVSGALNVGTGREASVSELVTLLAEIEGSENFEPRFAPARAGEVQRIAISPARAQRVLGWSAKVALEEGLRLTLASL
jgi:UDP-glucose 4-epimerase